MDVIEQVQRKDHCSSSDAKWQDPYESYPLGLTVKTFGCQASCWRRLQSLKKLFAAFVTFIVSESVTFDIGPWTRQHIFKYDSVTSYMDLHFYFLSGCLNTHTLQSCSFLNHLEPIKKCFNVFLNWARIIEVVCMQNSGSSTHFSWHGI